MVSVIIPTYNRAHCIKKSIKSVLNQSFSDIELIIVDDGSTDNTKEIINSFTDPRVKYVYQENAGACVARNHGIDIAIGDYIAFQDSDDTWHERKLEKQMDVLDRYPEIDIVVCQTKCTRRDGSVFVSMSGSHEGELAPINGAFGISTQVILMRKHVGDKIRFDEKVTRYQDLDFMLNAIQLFKVYFIKESLVERYIGDDSITNNPSRIYDMSFYFQEKYRDFMVPGSKLARFFSNNLMDSCAYPLLKKDDQVLYSNRALYLDKSLKTLVKYIFLKLNIYQIIKKYRR